MIGVHAFMIMNDNSTDETQCILDEYIQQKIVFQVKSERGEAYMFDVCVEQMKKVLKFSAREMATTWIATHDVDEFIWLDPNITTQNNSDMSSSSSPLELVVRSLLDRYIHMQSIVIPRFLFGTSGHDHYQPDLVIGRFTQRFDVEQCRQQQLQQQQESQRTRRLSIAFRGGDGGGGPQERRPVSMCSPLANVTTSYPGDGKGLSLVPALARNCWKPVLEENRRKNTTRWTHKRNRCHTTHFHQLRNRSQLVESDSLVFTEQERGNMDRMLKSLRNIGNSTSNTGKMEQQQQQQQQQQPSDYDDRFVGYAQVVDSIAIMHYMTRSKEEFFQRTCASDFLKKYHQCSDCTPETYLELAESYSNYLQDERMLPFVKPLQERILLLQKNNGSTSTTSSSTSSNNQCHVEPHHTEQQPWEYYRECWASKKIAHENVQQEKAKFGKQKRQRPRSTG
jgi:Glycosyl transferase family 2